MRLLFYTVAYLCAALVVAALLFLPLHQLIAATGEAPDSGRLLYRSGMLIAALGLLWLLPRLRLTALEIGYGLPARQFGAELLRGYLLGLVMLSLLAALILASGARLPDARSAEWWAGLLPTLLAGVLGGLLVGFIEETFFRGLMHGLGLRLGSLLSTVLVSAGLYAVVHFMRPISLPAEAEIGIGSGLAMLPSMLSLADMWAAPDSLAALFVVGLTLSLVRHFSGSIALCIGLHAGWILVIKLLKYASTVDPDGPMRWLVGRYDGVTGWGAVIWLLLCLPPLLYWLRGRRDV